ncbi:MAG: WxL domain-containing protein [Lactobacillales bacterium]|jgi:hypothetical protein|nr:WxL domain-containing protein [Lactobacillales bacterium]
MKGKGKMKIFNLKKSLIIGLLASGVALTLFASEKVGAEQQDTEAKIKFTIPKTKGKAGDAKAEPADNSLNLVHVPNLNFDDQELSIKSLIEGKYKLDDLLAKKDEKLIINDQIDKDNVCHYVHINDVRYMEGKVPGWKLVVKQDGKFKEAVNNSEINGAEIKFNLTKKSSGENGIESGSLGIDATGTINNKDYAIHDILSTKKEEKIDTNEVIVLKANNGAGRFNTLGYFDDGSGNSTFKLNIPEGDYKSGEYVVTLKWELKDAP